MCGAAVLETTGWYRTGQDTTGCESTYAQCGRHVTDPFATRYVSVTYVCEHLGKHDEIETFEGSI